MQQVLGCFYWVLIQLIVTPHILGKVHGQIKRGVPINRTVSSNWHLESTLNAEDIFQISIFLFQAAYAQSVDEVDHANHLQHSQVASLNSQPKDDPQTLLFNKFNLQRNQQTHPDGRMLGAQKQVHIKTVYRFIATSWILQLG